MLSRFNRFHGHGSVRRAYKQGRVIRSGFFSVHINHSDKIKTTKAAVVVSRKVHKSAVKRNRIRRRIYEQIRLLLPEIKQPVELVITVYKPEIADVSHQDLTQEIHTVLKRARLLN